MPCLNQRYAAPQSTLCRVSTNAMPCLNQRYAAPRPTLCRVSTNAMPRLNQRYAVSQPTLCRASANAMPRLNQRYMPRLNQRYMSFVVQPNIWLRQRNAVLPFFSVQSRGPLDRFIGHQLKGPMYIGARTASSGVEGVRRIDGDTKSYTHKFIIMLFYVRVFV